MEKSKKVKHLGFYYDWEHREHMKKRSKDYELEVCTGCSNGGMRR